MADDPSEAAGAEGPTFDDPPTTEVGFALAEKIVGGRFKLGERLSWGGMGTIYRALDLITQREVAVKIPHLGDPINDVRFQAESEAVRSVVCSSVIGYVAHGRDAAEPFLAMELVAGHPLWKHLQRGPLDPESTFGVARRIASALAAIHLGGWIHRDIKPGNVVVAPDGSVKLLDFGLSRPIDGDGTGTMTGQLVGTLGYMAPEQLGGPHTPDPRADVYSLAVVLYECLAGKRAFKRTLAEVMAKAPEPALDVRAFRLAPSYTSLLEQCLAREPGARPGDGLDSLLRLLAARDARFAHVALELTARVIHGLLRTGTARVDGDVRATALMAEVLAEMVAPCVVLRVGCDPHSTATPLAHATAIASALTAVGQPALANRLGYGGPGHAPADGRPEIARSVVLVVEDPVWCDGATLERLAKLARDRVLFVAFATSFDQDAPPALEAAPRARVGAAPEEWPTSGLDPMERWCLRSASMFGRRFSDLGIAHLVAGEEASDLAPTLASLLRAGWAELAPTKGAKGTWYRFTSGAALASARELAAPHEQRLGARIAAAYLRGLRASAAGPDVEPLSAVDVACAALAHPA